MAAAGKSYTRRVAELSSSVEAAEVVLGGLAERLAEQAELIRGLACLVFPGRRAS